MPGALEIPLLVASNPEMGGFGSADDGTLASTRLQAGSTPDESVARDMGHRGRP
jgi:beta-N-acetylhexosaminidase